MTATSRPNPPASAICLTEFLVHDGFISGAGLKFRCAIGKAGVTAQKREGDQATPLGVHRLVRLLYRADRLRPPACAVPLEPLAPTDGWCDDPFDPAYNRQITLPHGASHESLWRTDPLYDLIGILDWNVSPIVPHRGSAIFLHIATETLAPTAGCIALVLPALRGCLSAGLTAIRVIG